MGKKITNDMKCDFSRHNTTVADTGLVLCTDVSIKTILISEVLVVLRCVDLSTYQRCYRYFRLNDTATHTYVAFVCDLAKSSPRENAMVVPYHAGSSVVARCVPRIC